MGLESTNFSLNTGFPGPPIPVDLNNASYSFTGCPHNLAVDNPPELYYMPNKDLNCVGSPVNSLADYGYNFTLTGFPKFDVPTDRDFYL